MFWYLFLSVLVCTCSKTQAVNVTPCPFISDCGCQTQDDGSYKVSCVKFKNFPIFQTFSGAVSDISISGNFTSIPARAFYPLQNLQYTSVTFDRDFEIGNYYSPLVIDDDAFILSNSKSSLASIYFQSFKNMSIPTTALSKVLLSTVMFWNGDIETIKDNSFQGVQAASLEFINCNTKVVQPNAFAGLVITPYAWVTIEIQTGGLTSIPDAARNVPGMNYLYMPNNQIAQLSDNALCSFANCPTFLEANFELNLITSISDNAFGNVRNLTKLNLAYNLLTDIPVQQLQPIAQSLQTLNLGANKITTVPGNSFYQLKAITSLTLDGNPITNIENGAFNGVNFTTLTINMLYDLQTIDLLVTYGMAKVEHLQVTNCPMLQTVTVADYTKLPNTLQNIAINNGTDIRTIDPSIQYWLSQSTSHVLDISNNRNINCDASISWMANFFLCNPPQIQTTMTFCANSKQLLSNYLTTFTPSCR